MAYRITEKCISCGACAAECPVGCISQGEERFVIDQISLYIMWNLCRCLSC